MKKILILLFFTLTSCTVTKYLPAESKTKEITNYVDSVRYEVRDSVVLVPREYYKDYTALLDTLVINSPRSVAKAWVDTTYHLLAGTLDNRPEMPFKREIIYKDRIVEKRDTIWHEERIPYEVEIVKYKTPTWCWWLLGFNVLLLILFVLRIIVF